MKPEVEGECKMTQEQFDPLDMMSKLALLILEARTPDCSVKGRVEGPHCPNSEYQGHHQCSHELVQCVRASKLIQHIEVLWRNGIPLVIDILLFPDCEHGRLEAESLMDGKTVGQEYFVLLERWNIQCLIKRHGEWTGGVCTGTMLLQAVRSYLYFSQLSSWLASMHGCLPCNIAYRLQTPGEEGDVTFSQPPQMHSFPLGVYGSHCLKVMVQSLPRQQSFPPLPCQLQQHNIEMTTTLQKKEDPRIGTVAGIGAANYSDSRDSSCINVKCASSAASVVTEIQDSTSGTSPLSLSSYRWPPSVFAMGSGMQPHLTCESREERSDPTSETSSYRDSLEKRLLPLQLTSMSTQSPQLLDLHSPKVLMSVAVHNHANVAKKQLDLTELTESFQDPLTPSVQSGVRKSQRLISPMSPLDMGMFLANLQCITAPMPQCSYKVPAPLPTTYLMKDEAAAILRQMEAHDNVNTVLGYHDSEPSVSARFRKKKTLPYGGDPPPDLSTVTVAKTTNCNTAGPTHAQCQGLSQQANSTFFLRKLSSDRLTRDTVRHSEVKVKDKTSLASMQTEIFCSTPTRPDEGPSHRNISLSRPYALQLSDSINFTLRDLTKIVRSHELNMSKLPSVNIGMQHRTSEMHRELSSSSSSASSTSSSTYSSSPRMKVAGTKSDSSTPTNMSSSPESNGAELSSISTSNFATHILLPYCATHCNLDTQPNSMEKTTETTHCNLDTQSNSMEKTTETNEREQYEVKQGQTAEERKLLVKQMHSHSRDHNAINVTACCVCVETSHYDPGKVQLPESLSSFVLDHPHGFVEDRNIPKTASEDTLLVSTLDTLQHICVPSQSQSVIVNSSNLDCAFVKNSCTNATAFPATSINSSRNVSDCLRTYSVYDNTNRDPVEIIGVHVSQELSKCTCKVNTVNKMLETNITVSNDKTRKMCKTSSFSSKKPSLCRLPTDCEEDDSMFSTNSKAADLSPPLRTKSASSLEALSGRGRLCIEEASSDEILRGRSALRDKELISQQDRLRYRLVKSASMMFNTRGALPSQSSPAPIKRRSSGRFDYDETLTSTKAIKNAISMSRLTDVNKDLSDPLSQSGRVLSTSAPASTNCLLGNFEESMLNGRLEPAGVVEGFAVDIGASGTFCPCHVSLPVTAYFFNISDDNAPSPYLGHISLECLGKKGYHIPHKGTLQVTLFNPNKTVVKMFVVMYNLEDMPPNSQTVIRQRTVYMPADLGTDMPAYLRYLIHLRVCSSSSGKIYLHTDVRLIFARNKFELDSNIATYELRSFTDIPNNPKYSPKR